MRMIMFNDRYGLTQAVLDGKKTMTRRIARVTQYEYEMANGKYPDAPLAMRTAPFIKSRYKIGEVVAIAQSYREFMECDKILYRTYGDGYIRERADKQKGYSNKMYVAANLMPHQILITDIRLEKLQDISEEDCLKEGIRHDEFAYTKVPYYYFYKDYIIQKHDTPREAYSCLIDGISGKGTWERNLYVWVYEFELIK